MKKYEIERRALELRNKIGISNFFHEDVLRDRLEEAGYFLFYYPFGEKKFSGASYKQTNIRVIIVNSSYPLGRQNFTLAHELGHIELHKDNLIDLNGLSKEEEREADIFASHFVMPRDEVLSIGSLPHDSIWTVFDVMMLSQKFRVSYEAAFNRAREIFGKRIVPEALRSIRVGETAKAFGFSLELYIPTEESYMSENLYVDRILRAYKDQKISMGKFLSLANDIGLDGYEILDKIREEKNVRDR
jgi:Zn-dependent peptidase ImmA (M78 family)